VGPDEVEVVAALSSGKQLIPAIVYDLPFARPMHRELADAQAGPYTGSLLQRATA
jgi:hypothetical protein